MPLHLRRGKHGPCMYIAGAYDHAFPCMHALRRSSSLMGMHRRCTPLVYVRLRACPSCPCVSDGLSTRMARWRLHAPRAETTRIAPARVHAASRGSGGLCRAVSVPKDTDFSCHSGLLVSRSAIHEMPLPRFLAVLCIRLSFSSHGARPSTVRHGLSLLPYTRPSTPALPAASPTALPSNTAVLPPQR